MILKNSTIYGQVQTSFELVCAYYAAGNTCTPNNITDTTHAAVSHNETYAYTYRYRRNVVFSESYKS